MINIFALLGFALIVSFIIAGGIRMMNVFLKGLHSPTQEEKDGDNNANSKGD